MGTNVIILKTIRALALSTFLLARGRFPLASYTKETKNVRLVKYKRMFYILKM